jgi:hypothetical protein
MIKIPIVGKKQEPLAVLIKPTYGKDAILPKKRGWEYLVYCSIMRVREGTDISLGFVKNHIELFAEKKGLSPKAHGLLRGYEGTRKTDNLPIYRNSSLLHEGFHRSPGSHTAGGKKLIEPNLLSRDHHVLLLLLFLELLKRGKIRDGVYAEYFEKKIRGSVKKGIPGSPSPPGNTH